MSRSLETLFRPIWHVRKLWTLTDRSLRGLFVEMLLLTARELWFWELLLAMAHFPREYLTRAPASNCQRCRRMKLQHAFVLFSILKLNRPLVVLSCRRQRPALGLLEEDRDYPGDGWSDQGSDRYARIARLRTTFLQKKVNSAIHGKVVGGPFGEGNVQARSPKDVGAPRTRWDSTWAAHYRSQRRNATCHQCLEVWQMYFGRVT